jgi:hypothetical protein
MEYEILSYAEKIDIINQRILNLEKHIFHNEMLLSEHDTIGLFDEEGVSALNMQISVYTQQVYVLNQLKNGIDQIG